MRNLTLRGIALKKRIEALPNAPTVIESYPGAAQDILSIPRKQDGLDLLRDGLRQLGLTGPGLKTHSHDEMDSITSAIVGRYFEAGEFEPMGIPSEAQLIVPKVRPLRFDPQPVICLAGKSGSGKSVVARYLAVFYGFQWIHTRDVIRALLIDDIDAAPATKILNRQVDKAAITEQDLRDFGIIILEKYKQVPLRQKLAKIINAISGPVVVDSIRDVLDVDQKCLPGRSVDIWYIDISDTRLTSRLQERLIRLGKVTTSLHSIDRNADKIRNLADTKIENSGSLEDLRWAVDDMMFKKIQLTSPYAISR